MFTVNKVLEDLTALLQKEESPELKTHYSKLITDLIVNNYSKVTTENYYTKKDLEDEKYKSYLNDELKKLQSELLVCKKEAENEETDNNYAEVGDESDTENICIKKSVYNQKLKELEEFKTTIHEANYPIYQKEIEYKASLETQIDQLKNGYDQIIYNQDYTSTEIDNIKIRVDSIEDNERDIYTNINESKSTEREIYSGLDYLKTQYTELYTDVDDLGNSYIEKMYDLETRLNIDFEALNNNNEKTISMVEENNKLINNDLIKKLTELNNRSKRIEQCESNVDGTSEYAPFNINKSNNLKDGICPFPFTPV